MGADCGAICGEDDEVIRQEELRQRIDLSGMEITEYENRVKRYVDPSNKGKINVD